MNKNQEMLEKASYPKLLLSLSLPAVVIMLVMIVYNMADTFFIGQTGDPGKIAAISLCGPVFSILSGLGTLLGSGGCTAISLALGKKDTDKVKKYSAFCCYASLILGLLFLTVVNLAVSPISQALGADADTLSDTVSYLRIIAFGAPFIMFNNVFANVIRSDGAARESMIANCLGTLSNIGLDALFILVFSWDVAGAAFATVLGNCVSCAYLLYYVRSKQPSLSLSPKEFSLRPEVSLGVMSLGLPMAFSTLLNSVSHIIANRMVIGYGAVALAAQGVSSKIGMLITMLAMGICMGLQPAISYNYGSGNLKRMREIIRNTAFFTATLGSLLTIVCFFARNAIITAFIDNTEVIAYGQIFVFASIIIGPFYGLYQLCQTFLQSTGKASYATFVALLDKGLFFLPLLFVLSRLFGLYGIIFTGAVTLAFSLIAGIVCSLIWNRKISRNEASPQEAPGIAQPS
ncbi:multidrug export protein MepA [Lachnospiraceae bacterium]|jgi:multidrug efflux pump|nr:MATE family efflux transporter [uncultured Acetatifactor sp.]MCI8433751.1 MATE family efflux transporter [Lachnospiraceae bacterium]GFI66466.1 multidrug export protein MepA [Lachnospiraceae bacterium]